MDCSTERVAERSKGVVVQGDIAVVAEVVVEPNKTMSKNFIHQNLRLTWRKHLACQSQLCPPSSPPPACQEGICMVNQQTMNMKIPINVAGEEKKPCNASHATY